MVTVAMSLYESSRKSSAGPTYKRAIKATVLVYLMFTVDYRRKRAHDRDAIPSLSRGSISRVCVCVCVCVCVVWAGELVEGVE